MKKYLLLLATGLFVSFAYADGETAPKPVTNPTKPTQQQQQQTEQSQQTNAGASAGAVNAGNNQYVIFNSPEKTVTENSVHYSGSQTLKNVPSVNAAPLTSSNDTCMGSASGSINGPGFGVGLAKTFTDDNCVMLKNSREFWNMGLKAAAIARLCMDKLNREAFDLTDFECPQARREKKLAYTNAQQTKSNEPTDKYIRARLGLPPLE